MPKKTYPLQDVGRTTNRLTAIEYSGQDKHRKFVYLFQCSCGNQKHMIGTDVFSGRTKSCGCLVLEGQSRPKHGMRMHRVYKTWCGMKSRCQCSTNPNFSDYGGRGIKVCQRWQIFENFLEDMGEPSQGQSIDRIDVNGDYEPKNCRWANHQTQARNKRTSVYLNFNGKNQHLDDWAKELGMSRMTIYQRIKAGLTVQECLDPKPRRNGPYSNKRPQAA